MTDEWVMIFADPRIEVNLVSGMVVDFGVVRGGKPERCAIGHLSSDVLQQIRKEFEWEPSDE